VFFEKNIGDRRVEVLKTYDAAYAREAFNEMDEAARAFLWKALRVDETCEQGDIPSIQSEEGESLLWETLLEESREDGNLISFFLVNEAKGSISKSLYVSPDWPSAESYSQVVIGEM
jgi:hypothetical protein